jgi:16S rRNA (adenine1518-N6/adenine1519-N6)-dimethyltransferase
VSRRQPLGQHFLVRGSVLERIARAACPAEEPEPCVLEIGAGKGALTRYLLPRSERLIAIELDPRLAEALSERVSKTAVPGQLEILQADVLTVDLAQWGPLVVVGNLPYYITSPVLTKVLELGSEFLLRAVFLVQKEVALRIVAPPGSRDYGYLSVATQFVAHAELLFPVSPAAFHPPPQVESAVVRLTPRNERDTTKGAQHRAAFLQFASRCFQQKRKMLRANLAPFYGKEAIDAQPEARLRAEQLSVEQLIDLWRRLTY